MQSVLSRYVARVILVRTLALLLGLAMLMILVEFLGDADQVIATSDGVVGPLSFYMMLRLPDIMAKLIPITAMLAGLLAFVDLARHSELTAMMAAGMTRLRLSVAVLPVALGIAGVQFVIEDQLVPRSVAKLRAWGVGDFSPTGAQGLVAWLRKGDDILRIGRAEPAAGRLFDLTIFRRDRAGNFVEKIDAARATYQDGTWTLHEVSRLSALGIRSSAAEAAQPWSGPLAPELLAAVIAPPRETPWIELLHVVGTPGVGTQPSYRYKVWLHERLASPVTTVMLLLLAAALARPLRGGRAAQGLLVGIGLAVGFVCWTFDGLVLNLGELGLLPPILAAWAPVPVIGMIALSIALYRERSGHPSRDAMVEDAPGPTQSPAAAE